MNIKVDNSVPNLNVRVQETDDGNITILLTKDGGVTLGSVPCGNVVRIGVREFIVLGHGEDTTAVIAKESVGDMEFGSGGNWRDSDIRKFCNEKFYGELSGLIGKDNIYQHTTNLIADDGTGKGIVCKDYVSLLTTELYRRYREYLPASGEPWWLATRVTYDEKTGNSHYALRVSSYGILRWDISASSYAVRPFCILKSSLLVS